jgi:hypothetical protein
VCRQAKWLARSVAPDVRRRCPRDLRRKIVIKVKAPTGAHPVGLASGLVDVGNGDTVCDDVHPRPGPALLASVLAAEAFPAAEQQKAKA